MNRQMITDSSLKIQIPSISQNVLECELRLSGKANLEPSGSYPTSMVSGETSRNFRPTPVIVPPVPPPKTCKTD